MNTDTHTSGSMVKNHISSKTGFGHSATRRTSLRSWLQACRRVLPPVLILQDRRAIILHLPQARLLHLVDDRVPEHRDSHASSSHELSLEPTRSVDLGEHSVETHFPKDRNCEICQRTKIARASCRRRIGRVEPRAEIFGYLISADHKIVSEGCESRHNHRHAVVVQDLATQWIQSYPCKTKTSQETERSLHKFMEPNRIPKVIYTDHSLEFGEACEDLSWNHCTSTPHR